eukprot:12415169-Karenia_brevis.AAC.1
MPSNYSLTFPTQHTSSRELPSLQQVGALERLGQVINMYRTKFVDTLPGGRSIEDYLPADTMFRYEYHMDRPSLTLRGREMRRTGSCSTEPCTYAECADHMLKLARSLFHQPPFHWEFVSEAERKQ